MTSLSMRLVFTSRYCVQEYKGRTYLEAPDFEQTLREDKQKLARGILRTWRFWRVRTL